MKTTKKNKKVNTQIERYIIRPQERLEILWKSITKGRDSWDFYDVKYGDVIITGCRLVEGKNGVFLGMPSQERNGEYYPTCYISHALNERICEFIEDADNNDTWEEGEDGEILNFEDDNRGSKKAGSKRKTKNKKKDDNDNDEEESDTGDD